MPVSVKELNCINGLLCLIIYLSVSVECSCNHFVRTITKIHYCLSTALITVVLSLPNVINTFDINILTKINLKTLNRLKYIPFKIYIFLRKLMLRLFLSFTSNRLFQWCCFKSAFSRVNAQKMLTRWKAQRHKEGLGWGSRLLREIYGHQMKGWRAQQVGCPTSLRGLLLLSSTV